jgi:hypothetical protein
MQRLVIYAKATSSHPTGQKLQIIIRLYQKDRIDWKNKTILGVNQRAKLTRVLG